ncbi:hypothetical protein ACFSF0_17910 [Ottowia flava]|uniref:Apea-like HEPN domain-containing protein n=1 Tax=Ottowia flava TaxID=2675430 RepID=A0ABW4KYR5_9BURK
MIDVQPAGKPRSNESKALMLSSRTNGGQSLPEYYLVYFLLVDLLGYENIGQWEKVAWIIPVRYRGRLYSIEHRKFGVGIFAPNHDPAASRSVTPSPEDESDASEIATAINNAISIAAPYFEWRAEQAALTSSLNVVNKNENLFARYCFFRDKYLDLTVEAEQCKAEWYVQKTDLSDGTSFTTWSNQSRQLREQAKWYAQAAIEAFFGWTEHAFIHLAIIQDRIKTGADVGALAAADWKSKFKSALDLADHETKNHYDALLDLRAQVRNFIAHGDFGKQGEAFRFHSGAGAVPVLLTRGQRNRFSLTGKPAFEESSAMELLERFLAHLWSGSRTPAKIYIFSHLPSILTHTMDGTYSRAMASEQTMNDLVKHMHHQFDRAANMDW